MKQKIRNLVSKTRDVKDRLPLGGEPPVREEVPRITNETVAANREEVLSSARKYIYPLQHSKHRIVLITTTLVVIVLLSFFSYCMLALYKFRDNNGFLYRVTQVVPFPVARVGSHFVPYEHYLFQLRHYIHYYQTQQNLNFASDPSAKAQLLDYKQKALERVINNAYIQDYADDHDISVSDKEIQHQIDIARNENRLGASDKVLEDVLKQQWGWTLADFQRVLREQLLEEKVLSSLDTGTHANAQSALNALKKGSSFATLSTKDTDSQTTAKNGGDYGFWIDSNNRDIDPDVAAELFKLKPGQHSGVINTGYSLEIVKVLEKQGDKVKAAHLSFQFKNINSYLNDFKDKQHYTLYIHIPKN